MPPRSYRRITKAPFKARKQFGSTGSRMKLGRGKAAYKRGPALNNTTRKLFYSTEITMDAGSGSYSTYCFRANSLFDPDFTGGGHQPYGHDQLMEFYNYNRVKSSNIKVRFSPSAVTDLTPGYMAILTSTSATAPTFTDVDHFLEICFSQGVTPQPIGNFSSAFIGGKNQWLAANKWTYKKAFAAPSNDVTNWGTISSGPGASVTEYYHIVVMCIGGNNPSQMLLTTCIEYNAEFFEPKLLTES